MRHWRESGPVGQSTHDRSAVTGDQAADQGCARPPGPASRSIAPALSNAATASPNCPSARSCAAWRGRT